MKKSFVLWQWYSIAFLVVLSFVNSNACVAQQPQHVVASKPQNKLLFVENKGQVTDVDGYPRADVLFTIGNGGTKLFITATGIHYQFVYTQNHNQQTNTIGKSPSALRSETDSFTTSIHRVYMHLQGANTKPEIIKEKQNPYYENFFLPHCPQGITHVNTFEKITFKNIYNGIDWVLYNNNGALKYDFIVYPSANPNDIKLVYNGYDSIGIQPDGSLKIVTKLGELHEAAPIILQNSKTLLGKYILNKNTLTFNIPHYDKSQPLIIDPELAWGTYYGGDGYDDVYGVTTDKENNVYISGTTTSKTGIAINGYINTYNNGYGEAFLVKFDGNGNRIWGTYFGGENSCQYAQIACDANLNVVMAFETVSVLKLKGTKGQITNAGEKDIFLVKFDKNGGFIWSRFFGGVNRENLSTVKIDSDNNIYFGGDTKSLSGIAFNGYLNSPAGLGLNGFHGFFTKLNSDGDLIWSSYFGESLNGLCVDKNKDIYVTGAAFSSTTNVGINGFQNVEGGDGDSYLAKFTPACSIIWSTYYGGEAADWGRSCGTDNSGNVFIFGHTYSKTKISFNGFKSSLLKHCDFFVAKFNSAGARQWGTYCGSDSVDWMDDGVCLPNGSVVVVGRAGSSNGFLLQNSFIKSSMVSSDWEDGMIVKINSSGQLVWSTLIGGDLDDGVRKVSADSKGNLYAIGTTRTLDLKEMAGGFLPKYLGSYYRGPYLIKIKDEGFYISDVSPAKNAYCVNSDVTIKYDANIQLNTGNQFVFQLSDSLGDFSKPINLATKTSSTKGEDSIQLKIPVNIASGSKYAFRIVSTNSADTTTGYGNVVIENPKLKISFLGSQPACKGDTTELQAPLFNGYVYQWYKDGTLISNQKQNNLKASQPGQYYLLVTSSGGCWSFSDTLNISSPASGNVVFNGNTTACEGDVINFTDASTYTIAYNRFWKLSTGDTANQNTYSTVLQTKGQYTLTLKITTSAGCVDSVSKTIDVLSTPILAITSDKDTILCPTDTITLIGLTESGNTFKWYKDGNLINQATDSFYITQQKGKYTIETTNAGGCSQVSSINVNILERPKESFIIFKKNGEYSAPLICTDENEVLELSSLIQGNLIWMPTNSNLPTISVTDTGWVYLNVTSTNGCSFSDSVNITDGCDYTLFVPNAFSPNKKDNINPVFLAIGTNIIGFRIEVYSIWGDKVFESNNINHGWDGKYKNTDADCPSGVYLYLISYKGKTNKGFAQKSSLRGTITLIR